MSNGFASTKTVWQTAGAGLAALLLGTGMAAADPVEISFANLSWGEPGLAEMARKYVDLFEQEHPNITIKEVEIPYDRYFQTIALQIEAGSPPDVVAVADGSFFAWRDQDYLIPLDDYVDFAAIGEDFVDAQKLLVKDGKNYGIVYNSYPYAVLLSIQRPTGRSIINTLNTPVCDKSGRKLGVALNRVAPVYSAVTSIQ